MPVMVYPSDPVHANGAATWSGGGLASIQGLCSHATASATDVLGDKWGLSERADTSREEF
jgi:hypothetical protein